MKLKIFTSTGALDAGRSLDDIVNEFCTDHKVIDIQGKVEDGEVYIFVKYKEADIDIENDNSRNYPICTMCGYDENDPYRDVIAHEKHLNN